MDHSTTDFNQNYEFSKQAAAKEAHILEAPITGGLEALKKGQMAVWVSCVSKVGTAMTLLTSFQGYKWLKQTHTQFLTPFSDTVFHTL